MKIDDEDVINHFRLRISGLAGISKVQKEKMKLGIEIPVFRPFFSVFVRRKFLVKHCGNDKPCLLFHNFDQKTVEKREFQPKTVRFCLVGVVPGRLMASQRRYFHSLFIHSFLTDSFIYFFFATNRSFQQKQCGNYPWFLQDFQSLRRFSIISIGK
jgi:hypothetical protein